jgi:hypothetical protein
MAFFFQSNTNVSTIGLGLVLELVAMDETNRAIYRTIYDNQPAVVKFWPWSRVLKEKTQVSGSTSPCKSSSSR